MTIVSEMVGSFTAMANSTKSNFIRVEDNIQNIIQALNNSDFRQTITNLIQVYNIFLDNIHNLYFHLNEIETAIAFSKINVLHQSIIDTEELIILLKEIEQTDKLVFPVTYENIVNLERCIEIKAYIKQNQIKFTYINTHA